MLYTSKTELRAGWWANRRLGLHQALLSASPACNKECWRSIFLQGPLDARFPGSGAVCFFVAYLVVLGGCVPQRDCVRVESAVRGRGGGSKRQSQGGPLRLSRSNRLGVGDQDVVHHFDVREVAPYFSLLLTISKHLDDGDRMVLLREVLK